MGKEKVGKDSTEGGRRRKEKVVICQDGMRGRMEKIGEVPKVRTM